MYLMVLETLKLDKETKATRVDQLRTMPLDKIMAVPPPEVMYQPCADGVLYKEVPYWDLLANPNWKTDKPAYVMLSCLGIVKTMYCSA